MCFLLNFDVTKLHHISLAELNLFKMNWTTEQVSAVLKLYFQTQTPDIGE